jgi:hypothetical protein
MGRHSSERARVVKHPTRSRASRRAIAPFPATKTRPVAPKKIFASGASIVESRAA